MLIRLQLSEKERVSVRTLLMRIAESASNSEEATFLERANLLAQELPFSIRESFYKFKLQEASAGLYVTNNPVFPEDIGTTPQSHWSPTEARLLNIPQLMHGLYAALLGEPFGFASQQRGRIFNDLISISGAQSNSSSGAGEIGLHTEDCFQPFMPDYLGLLCLRNEQGAVTTFSSLIGVEIPEPLQRVLFGEDFPIRNSAQRHRVLFGDRARPYLRYGSIDYEKCTAEMVEAMRFLAAALRDNRQAVSLAQGDCLYLDNFVAVHGRAPFQAEYGPQGRWFCRLVMTRDLRKTRSLRAGPESRVMLNLPRSG